MIESTGQIKILLIDDDSINNFLNEKLLKINYHELAIEICVNAKTALEKLHGDYHPDLILLDLNMPGINGWMFLDEFRNYKKKIPVIILSSSIDPRDRLKSKQYSEVIDFIEKPLNTIKINKLLNSIPGQKT